ncbi:MAG TPA: GLUG motif-containing protein [Bacteroidota bacterium]|nr:GLUG motif-containing protein [Bacteroidota bacterium]
MRCDWSKLLGKLISVSFAATLSFAQTATTPSGSGTAGDPYLIDSLSNLYWVTQNSTSWSSFFRQTADIDASASSGWNSGSGFAPIGGQSTSFDGTYDGNGHTIDSLYISNSNNDYIGMFGLVSDGTIRNLRLTNENITGGSEVGGLVGMSTGSGSSLIDSCSTGGVITGSDSQETGGLVGMATAASTIRNCYSSALVNGANLVGGLVGHNDQGTVISNCYSTGSVNGSGSGIGGLVGYNTYTSPANAQIVNSYAIGKLIGSGVSQVGGLVGGNGATISNSFWNTDSSGSTGVGAGSGSGATGATSGQMQTLSTFTGAGWDFVLETANGTNDYWDMDTTHKAINHGYPFLSWEDHDTIALPVELTAFAGTSTGADAVLSWKTATEVQNAGFEIERMTDKQPTAANSWKRVGFVGGAGTSNAPHNYSFTDNVGSSGSYSYRLMQIDRNGAFTYSQTVTVNVAAGPRIFSLGQNYPNPFNPSTTIQFTVPEDGRASLKIYDAIGQEVATLFNSGAKAGEYHQATFDASRLASGIYFARLEFGGTMLTKKMMLLK